MSQQRAAVNTVGLVGLLRVHDILALGTLDVERSCRIGQLYRAETAVHVVLRPEQSIRKHVYHDRLS
jgi:hypothetical protein